MKTKKSGFFIVEVLIVLVLLAILTLIFLPNLQAYVEGNHISCAFAFCEKA